MMLDVNASLDAAGDVIEGWQLLAPEEPYDPLWRTLVRLAGDEDVVAGPSTELSPFLVGAYGNSRRDSLVRGIGEAIERYALVPQAADASRPLPDAPPLDVSSPEACLGGRPTGPVQMSPFPAESLVDGSTWTVPVAVVDYPHRGPEEPGVFDPGPSGAASGIGVDAATRAALLEVVERDAMIVAWDTGAVLRRVDVAALTERPSGRDRSAAAALTRILRTTASLGLDLVVAELPTALDGVLCVTAVVIDPTAPGTPRVGVGCKAHDSAPTAVLGAVQEAFQLRSAQVGLFAGRRPDRPDRITDEQDRLAWLACADGAEAVLEWVSSFEGTCHPTTSERTSQELVAAMATDGGRPLRIDLTPRLPRGLRDLGWAVVKVLPLGYQPFRLDEHLDWSWNAARRARAVERLDAAGTLVTRPEGGGPPHPLP